MGWSLTPQNIAAIGLIPFTGGLSLAMAKDNEGYSLFENVTGEKSAREAEKRQKQYQDETNQLSIELANSAHQREVADLKAAGLNPVLSAGGSGSATPVLGTATAQNTLPGGYMAQATQAANIANMFGQAKQATSAAKLANAQADLQPAITQSEIQKNQAEATLALVQAGNQGTKTTAMKNAENLANTWWGRNVSPILADVGQIFGGAGTAGITAATSARNANTMANAIKSTPHTHVHYH